MFFSAGSRTAGGRLERGQMDGRERTTILSQGIVFPLGLAVDPPRREIYWLDRDVIMSCHYDGTHRKTVTREAAGHSLYGLAVFQNKLYLPAWRLKTIVSVNKFQPSNMSM